MSSIRASGFRVLCPLDSKPHPAPHHKVIEGNEISAASQDIPFDVHFRGREDHPNGQMCGSVKMSDFMK
jgi:hypothetical protein